MVQSEHRGLPRSFRPVALACALGLAGGGLATFVKALRTADGMLHPPRIPVTLTAKQWVPSAEEVAFRSADGLLLSGWYAPSRNGAAVVLAHGHGENRTQLLPEARFLSERGFGVLLFDWRAHGNSEGALSTRGDRELDDFAAALDWLAARPDVRHEQLGAFGFSRGANVVLQAAANDTRIHAVVAGAAAPSMVEGIRWDLGRWSPLLLWPTMLVMRWNGIRPERLEPIAHMCEIAPRPLLLLAGERDAFTPPSSSEALLRASCGNAQLWQISGAGHGEYARFAGEAYAQRVSSFFEGALLVHESLARQPDVARVHTDD